eukprot:SAG25_NODE_306_length_10078_cov_13.534923_6_plen_185_part_00
MNSLFQEFSPQGVLFRLVYIAEAHATDEWPISSARYTTDGEPVQLRQPRTAAERIDAATRYQKAYGITMPVFVDPPLPASMAPQPSSSPGVGTRQQEVVGITASFGADGAFEAAYAPWPLRFYGCTLRQREEDSSVAGGPTWMLHYIASPQQCSYSLSELRDWITEALQQQQQQVRECDSSSAG